MRASNDILVSVICLAYNHEKYIKKTLESVVNQKTNFKYEIIIHDDNSTDNTTKIINEYAQRYPHKIKTILETTNQYSQGKDVSEICLKICSGKYIAFCECDDYWCDSYKLQLQVDFLEKNLDYSACTCATMILNDQTHKKEIMYPLSCDTDFSIEDIINWDKKHYQTASLLMRKEYYNLPSQYYIKGIKDYPIAIYLRTKGKIRYLCKVMTVYRYCSDGSWTTNLRKNDDLKIELIRNTTSMLYNILSCVPDEFKNSIISKIRFLDMQLCIIRGDYPSLIDKYPNDFLKLSFMDKLKIRIKYYLPSFYKNFKKYLSN